MMSRALQVLTVGAFLGLGVILLTILTGCGAEETPQAAPELQGEDDKLVARECGRCHNGSQPPRLLGVEDLKKARAKGVIASGRMPPDRRLGNETKSKLLSLAE
jgi:hypothetical protein